MKIYVQEATVKKVEERFKTQYLSGTGKDAKTVEVSDGWWITFHENLTALHIPAKEINGVVTSPPRPDIKVGDKAVDTWEFKR